MNLCQSEIDIIVFKYRSGNERRTEPVVVVRIAIRVVESEHACALSIIVIATAFEERIATERKVGVVRVNPQFIYPYLKLGATAIFYKIDVAPFTNSGSRRQAALLLCHSILPPESILFQAVKRVQDSGIIKWERAPHGTRRCSTHCHSRCRKRTRLRSLHHRNSHRVRRTDCHRTESRSSRCSS